MNKKVIMSCREIGKKLKSERKSRKLSKAKASKQMGINVVTLGRIESGFSFHAQTGLKILKWLENPYPLYEGIYEND